MEDYEAPELYGDMDREEAMRRFPEVHDIKDSTLREQVIGVIREMPDYFWTAPASKRNHQTEHRARHGLWLHTKRVCTAFEELSKSMVKQNHLTWDQIDYGRAACILHDMFKYGIPPVAMDGTRGDHDVIAAKWLRDHTELPPEVADSVEAHNGPWYAGSPPTSHLQQMVHIADMTASREGWDLPVKDLHPVLKERFPNIRER